MSIESETTSRRIREAYPYDVDLTNCDKEPISFIQIIQANTCLLAVDADTLTVNYVSDNADHLIGIAWEELLDSSLTEHFSVELIQQIRLGTGAMSQFEDLNPIQAHFLVAGVQKLKNVVFHFSGDYLILEIEPISEVFRASSYQSALSKAVQKIQSYSDYQTLFSNTASLIRQLVGFDRVLVYRFDAEYNGEVIAEDRGDGIESFLGLRYPHTDIPPQARALYFRNRIRGIANVGEVSAKLITSDSIKGSAPLDLSLAHSRGVSPVHLEYLENMGVEASMSIGIVLNGRLWGLFALHHYAPKFLDFNVRSFLVFLSHVFSGHLAIHASAHYREQSINRTIVRSGLGEQMAGSQDLFTGLTTGKFNLLNFLSGTTGAGISFHGRFEAVGECPPQELIESYLNEIGDREDSELVHSSSSVSEKFGEKGAGILVIFLDASHTDWICWFRPEVAQELSWAGKPVKQTIRDARGVTRIGPRKSFSRYVELVNGKSNEWTAADLDAALALRVMIKDSVLRRFAEIQQINEELKEAYQELETFSYTVSHDLRAPLRAIDGFTSILHEDYNSVLDEEGRGLIDQIFQNVKRMNKFITDILELSGVGRSAITRVKITPRPLVLEIYNGLIPVYGGGRKIKFSVAEDLPILYGDVRLIRQLFTNLLANAIKYVGPGKSGELSIRVDGVEDEDSERTIYTVSNSGVPIPAAYREIIFEIFGRATEDTTIEGTGIGLAIVKRIVEKHAGRLWLGDEPEGVQFHFTLSPDKL